MVYDITWHDDETLQKVNKAMTDAGIDGEKIVDAIFQILNAGILFRETSVGRTISFGEKSPEVDLRQRTEQLNASLGPDIKLHRIDEEYYRPLRSDPDQNPFKKLEHERRQDDPSLD